MRGGNCAGDELKSCARDVHRSTQLLMMLMLMKLLLLMLLLLMLLLQVHRERGP